MATSLAIYWSIFPFLPQISLLYHYKPANTKAKSHPKGMGGITGTLNLLTPLKETGGASVAPFNLLV